MCATPQQWPGISCTDIAMVWEQAQCILECLYDCLLVVCLQKGSVDAPRCGFSRRVVQALQECNVSHAHTFVKQRFAATTACASQHTRTYHKRVFPCSYGIKLFLCCCTVQVTPHGVDILEDEALRQGLKQWANWPTYPQLYVKGEFVGGCDIVEEMKVRQND